MIAKGIQCSLSKSTTSCRVLKLISLVNGISTREVRAEYSALLHHTYDLVKEVSQQILWA